MGLGGAATIVASNIVQVFLIVVAILRLMRLTTLPRQDSKEGWVFPASVSLVLVALGLQTSFYIAARLLKHSDVANLWAMHPAPALVSLILTFSVYWLMPSYFRALGFESGRIRKRCAIEMVLLLALWAGLQQWLA